MSGFYGLQIAMSGLRANQTALNVTAHNISNAATEGYHRQEAVFVASTPMSGPLATGTGVSIQTVRRMQSQWVDSQLRTAYQWQGMWDYRNETMKQVEAVLAEPGNNGLSRIMNDFWNAWSELAASPDSLPARTALVESAGSLTNKIQTLHSDLQSLQYRANTDVTDTAKRINQLAEEIARLNQETTKSITGGFQPNDTLDQRDLLIDELSQLVPIQVHGNGGSEIIITVGGHTLIQGDMARSINVTENPVNGMAELTWSDDKTAVFTGGGQLAGQIQIRDDYLGGYLNSLNAMTQTLASQVNTLHITGQTLGGDSAQFFFTDAYGNAALDSSNINASNIKVNANIVASPAGVATSTTGKLRDNDLVLSIAAIRDSMIMPGGETISAAYSTLVARIGADAREAATRAEAQTLTLRQLYTQRESVSGVSMDDEMANMIRFQQSYNACARMVSVIDEMMETLIMRTGVGGR